MKVILVLSFTFAAASASFNCISSEFCPEGSCLFLVAPNANGTCPTELPQVHSKDEEDVNPCGNDSTMTGDKMCGLCMEFGPNGALQVPLNPEIPETCDVGCENGGPICNFLATIEDGELGEDRKADGEIKVTVETGRWKITITIKW